MLIGHTRSDSGDSEDEEPQDTGPPNPRSSTEAELIGIVSHLDTGPTVIDAIRWSDDPTLCTS